MGRPHKMPVDWYHDFKYQAKTYTNFVYKQRNYIFGS